MCGFGKKINYTIHENPPHTHLRAHACSRTPSDMYSSWSADRADWRMCCSSRWACGSDRSTREYLRNRRLRRAWPRAAIDLAALPDEGGAIAFRALCCRRRWRRLWRWWMLRSFGCWLDCRIIRWGTTMEPWSCCVLRTLGRIERDIGQY